jgi:hypothetical protein
MVDDLAQRMQVDAKTVSRWISTERVPHPRSRTRAAEILGVPAAVLWPEASTTLSGPDDLTGFYRTRTDIPPAMVQSLLAGATTNVDVLAFAGSWLWDTVPGFARTLIAKAESGVAVRVCLGDPESEAVRIRGQEEGIGDGMAARCKLALTYAQPLADAAPGAVRRSGATLYASILRFDRDVLLNTHLWSVPAGDAPVFTLRMRGPDSLAAHVIASFDRVWEHAQVVGYSSTLAQAPQARPSPSGPNPSLERALTETA